MYYHCVLYLSAPQLFLHHSSVLLSADTDEFLFCINNTVCIFNQHTFVNINFWIQSLLKINVSGIQINTYKPHLRFFLIIIISFFRHKIKYYRQKIIIPFWTHQSSSDTLFPHSRCNLLRTVPFLQWCFWAVQNQQQLKKHQFQVFRIHQQKLQLWSPHRQQFLDRFLSEVILTKNPLYFII